MNRRLLQTYAQWHLKKNATEEHRTNIFSIQLQKVREDFVFKIGTREFSH